MNDPVPDEILDGLAVQSALSHLGPLGLDTLRDAAEGRPLNEAQRQILRNGWNGRLILPGDRLTRLGELAYSTASGQLAAPERQSPQIGAQERETLARQRQLQSRNIAQREEARDKAETLARKVEQLKAQEAGIKIGHTPEQAEHIEHLRQQEREIVREAPAEVRARMPRRDRGLER